jgi:anti-sigma regulatory factor (Ser/Thr protein kinase)
MSLQQLSCELPPAARSVTEARRFVLAAIRRWGLDTLADTAALLTSEVVTNAVLHARTPVQVAVHRLAGGIRVEVTDGSRRTPTVRRQRRDATNGRGVALLDQLASEWDVTVHDAGKTLAFTISATDDPWAAYTGEGWSAKA